MPFALDRRSFLRNSAVLGSVMSCSVPLDRSAGAIPLRIDAPVVDQVTSGRSLTTRTTSFNAARSFPV
jgi:hypothetical protein